MPKVSIILPVFNANKHIKIAINSMLLQTFKDFELIILDDGSTDDSIQVIQQFKDKRIKIYQNDYNKGLIFSLNRLMQLANSQYIIRMDADDISFPNRLFEQVRYMETNPDFIVSGSWVKTLDSFPNRTRLYPVQPEYLKTLLLFYVPIVHPSTVFRNDLMKMSKSLYDEEFQYVEDYDLWVRLSKVHQISNCPQVLLGYRINPTGICHTNGLSQIINNKKVIQRMYEDIGFIHEQNMLDMHFKLELNNRVDILYIQDYFSELENWNLKTKYFNKGALNKVLSLRWMELFFFNFSMDKFEINKTFLNSKYYHNSNYYYYLINLLRSKYKKNKYKKTNLWGLSFDKKNLYID